MRKLRDGETAGKTSMGWRTALAGVLVGVLTLGVAYSNEEITTRQKDPNQW